MGVIHATLVAIDGKAGEANSVKVVSERKRQGVQTKAESHNPVVFGNLLS